MSQVFFREAWHFAQEGGFELFDEGMSNHILSPIWALRQVRWFLLTCYLLDIVPLLRESRDAIYRLFPYQWDYLEVLFAALSTAGTPNAIVSDGGAIFYCNQAMDVYSALGITKERIEKRQAWQKYIESHFNIVRRMSDAKFAKAKSWEEMLAIHRFWMHGYNVQRHWAHECPLGLERVKGK